MKYSNDYAAPIGVEGIHILNTGDWRILSPVLDQAACVRCGLCFLYCPVNSIRREPDGKFVIDQKYCKGCGICAHECKKNAIAMEAGEEK